ncbi:MAG: RidA family protein [Pyramidobacter sp.]|nr:RidA family protein [Pyramidobacter sp.]
MDVYQKLREMDLALPTLPVSGGNYALVTKTGNLLFTSGQTPKENGVLIKKGKVGREVSEEEGYQLAKRCTLNALAAVENAAGSLDNVVRIVKVTVFVSSDPAFTAQAKVAHGATDLLVELFGAENGRPARSAVGMAVLPGDAPCEVELIAEVKEQ